MTDEPDRSQPEYDVWDVLGLDGTWPARDEEYILEETAFDWADYQRAISPYAVPVPEAWRDHERLAQRRSWPLTRWTNHPSPSYPPVMANIFSDIFGKIGREFRSSGRAEGEAQHSDQGLPESEIRAIARDEIGKAMEAVSREHETASRDAAPGPDQVQNQPGAPGAYTSQGQDPNAVQGQDPYARQQPAQAQQPEAPQ